MLSFPTTPRRLALLALFALILLVTFFSSVRYSDYVPNSLNPPSFKSSRDESTDSGLPIADKPDVSSLASAFGIDESELHSWLDIPTSQSNKDIFQALSNNAKELEALRAETTPLQLASDGGSALPLNEPENHGGVDPASPTIPEPEPQPKPEPEPASKPTHKSRPFHEVASDISKDLKWDNGFYMNNGINSLQAEPNVKPEIHRPYPAFNSPAWKATWRGEYSPCRGARGKLLNESDDDLVKTFPVGPSGFPKPSLGDAATTFLNPHSCFDRYHRYGPYGFRHSGKEDVEGWQRPKVTPDWTSVLWGQLQDQCVQANQDRFLPSSRHPIDLKPGKAMPKQLPRLPPVEQESGPQYHHRTAVLLRTTDNYPYTENDLQSIRAIITELSLLSGGEYQVFNLVHVKNQSIDIFRSPKAYEDVLRTIPKELRSFSILWNDQLLEEWYPKVGYWNGAFHSFMPLQWFIIGHPEFDYVWNWDMAVRFTGSHYEFLEGLATYAKHIPRKHMWERNQRFYVPSSEKDYTYTKYLLETDDIVRTAVDERDYRPIWGPQPYDENVQRPIGPQPPGAMQDDGFSWGNNEEADLITLQPIFDPTETLWDHKDNIWNFYFGARPAMKAGDPVGAENYYARYTRIPRRTSLGSTVRLSKRQLYAMHLENLEGRTMHAEMWPATVALQHGLKAVFAPHPVWTNRQWKTEDINDMFNFDRGEAARWNQNFGSVYDANRIHNLDGLSWSTGASFPKALYRRWLGWTSVEKDEVPGIGGDMWEQKGLRIKLMVEHYDKETDKKEEVKEFVLVGGKGRMCLPAMFLHPVRDIYEAAEAKPAISGNYG